jgi:hypothetical protein
MRPNGILSEEDCMKPSYVEVAKFDAWAEADIFRCRLEAQGISAVLIGPNTSSTLGMYMGVASKVSVMVPEASAERAEKILKGEGPPRAGGSEKGYRSSAPNTPTRLLSRRGRKITKKK